MKLNFKKINYLFLGIILIVGCKKYNQWEVQPEFDRLFRPLDFEYITGDNDIATTAQFSYNLIAGADEYIFEFSKDAGYDDLYKSVVILSDTLTPFALSSTPTRTQYRTVFEGFEGNTTYYARMKGVDTASGQESQYVETSFTTGAEQIFKKWLIYSDSIRLFWDSTKDVTNIGVFDTLNAFIKNKDLTEDEINQFSASIDGLKSGTPYLFQILKGTNVRGQVTIKTSGLEGGTLVQVKSPNEDLDSLLKELVSQGKSKISLVFQGGEAYDLSNLSLPPGLVNLGLIGAPGDDNVLPVLNRFRATSSDLDLEQLLFEQVDMTTDNSGDFMVFFDKASGLKSIDFIGGRFSNYRALVRLNSTFNMDRISFDNSFIHNTGGYGVVNIGKNDALVELLSFKNCTLTDVNTQLMDVRAPLADIYIGHNTFCNLNNSTNYLLRFDNKQLPKMVTTEDNIFSGNNMGVKEDVSYSDLSGTTLNLSFGGSYITSDVIINRYVFPNITLYNGTTYDLFVDPDNGNFKVKPDAGFGGLGKVGDPRWF